jgi:hypothetical protein
MYTNTINKYKNLNWIAFIEVDEFILPQSKDFNLHKFFKNINTKCVYVNSWDFKGPFNEQKPILGQSYECWTDNERYTNGYMWRGKSIIKPSEFLKCMDAHHFMQIDNTISNEFKYERNLLQIYHGKEVFIDDNILRICHYRNHTPFTNNYINIKDKIIKNICIIGGGWYGCYIAEYLLEHYNNLNITIIDERNDIFEGSSSNNQNRLHLGFHYPKCSITRNKCKDNFNKFINKYKDIIFPINKNYYVISNKSNINYDNYIKLYDANDYNIIENKLFTNIENKVNLYNHKKTVKNSNHKILMIPYILNENKNYAQSKITKFFLNDNDDIIKYKKFDLGFFGETNNNINRPILAYYRKIINIVNKNNFNNYIIDRDICAETNLPYIKYLFVLRGDTQTRLCFYQCFAFGVIPILYQDDFKLYNNLILPVNLSDSVFIIPNYTEDLNEEMYNNNIINMLKNELSNNDNYINKVKNHKIIFNELNYFTEPLCKPIENIINKIKNN